MTDKTTTGSTYVTPSCTFTPPSGMTFDKWALNSTTGTKYAVGSTISGISKNITLYATWKEDTGGGGGGQTTIHDGTYSLTIDENDKYGLLIELASDNKNK